QLQRRQRLVQALNRAHRLPSLGVVQDHVALAEGAALGVLAREADRRAFGQKRGERERLRVRPVDATSLVEALAPPLELFDELGVDREPLGNAQEFPAQLPQPRRGYYRLDLVARQAVQL